MEKLKVLVIVGPTASGKTSLSIELAKKHNGEIVSADSRQVYRGLDLGTGKVTREEMDGVLHHLLDIADPKDQYTVADFVRDGRKTIADIHARGKLPIIVGGTFFYIDALLGRVATPDVGPNPALRAKLESLQTETLFESLALLDPERAETIDRDNRRRIVRALEIIDALGVVPRSKTMECYDARIIGLKIDKEVLYQNIHARLKARVDAGMIEEVIQLHESALTYERMEDLGLEYRYIARFLQGKMSKEEMLIELETKIRQYAKRQMTWLKRDKSIVWIKKEDQKMMGESITEFLRA